MLHTLRALDFRCWNNLSLDVSDHGGIFVGANAQGKTSILEAVCVLLRLQSPRTHRLTTITRIHTAGFGISGHLGGTFRKVRHHEGALIYEVDGEPRPTAQDYLCDSGLVVWMGNEDLDLIRGSGDLRRRYLDFIGSQWDPEYRHHWSRYRRAVKMKNALLKQPYIDEKQILACEEIMILSGTHIADVRQRMLHLLEPAISSAHNAICGSHEIASLEYRRSGGHDLRASLHQARENERRTRQANTGPHRDDLILRINSQRAADFASEGQQRTLALALKLAQGELLRHSGRGHPIYLIDDIFGELDHARRNALMSALPSQSQKWITTTNLDWWNEKDSFATLPRFHVCAGSVS